MCYKLSPRTDFYRAPVALKVMGVSYISSQSWLTEVTTAADTFVLDPAFLAVGDVVAFVRDNTEVQTVTTTVTEVSTEGALLEPVVFMEAGNYAVKVTFASVGKTFVAPFQVEVVDSTVTLVNFKQVYAFKPMTAVPVTMSAYLQFVPIEVKYVAHNCSEEAVGNTLTRLAYPLQSAMLMFPEAAEYAFCQKSGEEPWREVEELRLTFLTLEPKSQVVSVNMATVFELEGNGIRDGDMIRWTPTTEGSACSHALLVSTVANEAVTVTVPEEVVDDVLYACYRIRDDSEYILHMDNTLVIRGGFVVSPSLAFTGLTTYLTVDARSISMEDRVKFVPVSESCAAEAAEYAYMEGRVYTVEVTFAEAAEYKMCYKYADEATYLEVPEYVMHVHSTEEAVVLPVHADVTEGVTISLLGEQRSPEQEKYLAPEKMSVVRELSTAAVYGDVSSIADEKDFTYARFLGAADVAVVYKLQSPVVLSSVVLKSASGARSVMKATVYISVHSASGRGRSG